MKIVRLLIVLLFVASIAACAPLRPKQPITVLFVGNSLTYVGNLPAVLDALAASSGRNIQSDMIVKGGATLTQRVGDETVKHATAAKHYDYVVLQERGGDSICSFGPASCTESETSLRALAKIAVQNGSKPIFLGTYQSLPEASKSLVLAEAAAAGKSIPYVSVSEHFLRAMHSQPSADWLYADGMHPGHDLILLKAALLYRSIFGELPRSLGFTVTAPMFTPSTHFALPAPVSRSPELQGVASSYTYAPATVATVLAIARED